MESDNFERRADSTTGEEAAELQEQIKDVERLLQLVDPYKILEVPRNTTEEDLNKQYRNLARKYHPDKNKAPRAEEAMKAINKAKQSIKRDIENWSNEDVSDTSSDQEQFHRQTNFTKFHFHSPENSTTHMQGEWLFMYFWCGLILIVLIMLVLYSIDPDPRVKLEISRKRYNKHLLHALHAQHYDESRLAKNDLPILQHPLVGRGEEILQLMRSLDFLHPPYIVNIYGNAAIGKSSIAIYLGYEMASQGVDVRYIDLRETRLLSAPSDVMKGYFSLNELVEWAADLEVDTVTVLILDNCNLLESSLSNLLLQTYKATEFQNLRIVITTRNVLERSEIPAEILDKTSALQLKELNAKHAHSLLDSLTTIKLTEKECHGLTHLAGNYPIAVKILASILNKDVSSDVTSIIAKLKRKMTAIYSVPTNCSVPRDCLLPLWVTYEQMDMIGKGCARYLSLFPGSFKEEAALQILASSGFSDPTDCIETFVDYSLMEQYELDHKQRLKLPRVVKDFFTYIRRNDQYHEYETATFQKGFKKYYALLLDPLASEREDSKTNLRVESHNVRYLHSVP